MRFDGFPADFEERFGVRPLWLEIDHLDHTGEAIPKPRPEVVIERIEDYRTFMTGPDNFDAARQRNLGQTLLVEGDGVDVQASAEPAGRLRRSQRTFEPVAEQDAHRSVTKRGRSPRSRHPSASAMSSGARREASDARSYSSTPTPRLTL